MDSRNIIKKMLNGDVYSLAKIISMVESNSPDTGQIMQEIFPHCTDSVIIGITGPPGAGKSSVIYQLARKISLKNKKIAILAIDPNSHITGGALLGDRIRMDDLTNVYIRSIGNRCATGGISTSAYFIIKILEACNFDYIFIETVGAGQSEVKIKDFADIIMLILAPGLGDDIQANKAGIMEIGDIFVVNKADKPDALRLELELKDMAKSTLLETVDIPIFSTDCINQKGFDEIIEYINNFSSHKNEIEKLKVQYVELLENRINELIRKNLEDFRNTDEIMNEILLGELNIIELVNNNIKNIVLPDEKNMILKNELEEEQ